VTCCAHDADGRTWLGHQDGSLKVVYLKRGVKGAQERAALDLVGSGAALRSMAFDHHGRCLVGDDLGNIHIVQMGANWRLQVQGNHTTKVEANLRRPAVQAIATHGRYAFSSGGVIDTKHPHAIRVWDMHGDFAIHLVEAPCTYGAVTSLAIWQPYAPGSSSRGTAPDSSSSSGTDMAWLLSGHEGGQVAVWRLQHDREKGHFALQQVAGPFGATNTDT